MNKNMNMSSIIDTPKRIQSFFTPKVKKEENNIIAKFQKKHSFEKRKSESFRILEEYPNRVPIICERINNDIMELDRKKYLVPNDLTMGNFMRVIRKRLSVAPEVAIYLFVNTKIIPTSMIMDSIYDKNKHDDGFLYIYYSGESTFG
jgi:GABA(A) receptor-associated protein